MSLSQFRSELEEGKVYYEINNSEEYFVFKPVDRSIQEYRETTYGILKPQNVLVNRYMLDKKESNNKQSTSKILGVLGFVCVIAMFASPFSIIPGIILLVLSERISSKDNNNAGDDIACIQKTGIAFNALHCHINNLNEEEREQFIQNNFNKVLSCEYNKFAIWRELNPYTAGSYYIQDIANQMYK